MTWISRLLSVAVLAAHRRPRSRNASRCRRRARTPAGSRPASRRSIPRTGDRTTLVDDLPSSQTAPTSGGFVSGVADIAFVDDTLYAVEAGAGCSHGLLNTVNSVLRVDHHGQTTQVANLSAFVMAHPVAHPNPPDFEPDGTWYSMVAVDGHLHVVEPNHGEVDVVNPWTASVAWSTFRRARGTSCRRRWSTPMGGSCSLISACSSRTVRCPRACGD